MSERSTGARATLEAWREQGADRLDPLRFHAMDALEKRAAMLDGQARQLLDQRLAAWLDAYAGDIAQRAAATDMVERTPAAGALRALAHNAGEHAAYPELPALEAFRQRWERLRTESHVRQTLEQVPENAGPLNSSTLVHRSIALMSELSPEYLQRFLGYVDALSWLEQLQRGIAAAKDAPKATPARRRSREKKEKAQPESE
jgi:hypothetical protein